MEKNEATYYAVVTKENDKTYIQVDKETGQLEIYETKHQATSALYVCNGLEIVEILVRKKEIKK